MKNEKLAQYNNVINFVKDNVSFQPNDWIIKETTYYFVNKAPVKQIAEKKMFPIVQNIQKISGNIRSTIDTHIVSNISNNKSNKFSRIEGSETKKGNHEKFI